METFTEYLQSLLEQGLIRREIVEAREKYYITEKGVKVLIYFKKVKVELPPLNLPP